jgi:hypothetical protein
MLVKAKMAIATLLVVVQHRRFWPPATISMICLVDDQFEGEFHNAVAVVGSNRQPVIMRMRMRSLRTK